MTYNTGILQPLPPRLKRSLHNCCNRRDCFASFRDKYSSSVILREFDSKDKKNRIIDRIRKWTPIQKIPSNRPVGLSSKYSRDVCGFSPSIASKRCQRKVEVPPPKRRCSTPSLSADISAAIRSRRSISDMAKPVSAPSLPHKHKLFI